MNKLRPSASNIYEGDSKSNVDQSTDGRMGIRSSRKKRTHRQFDRHTEVSNRPTVCRSSIVTCVANALPMCGILQIGKSQ